MKIVVLGCGLVGSAMGLDLAHCGHDVTVSDVSKTAFSRLGASSSIQTKVYDLANPQALHKLVQPFDLVVGAVPGFMGYQTVKTVLEAGRSIVDISFFPEDPFDLEDVALQHGVTAILDCGVAPGFSHVAFGYLSRWFDEPLRLVCYVGGLPAVRIQPFEYRIVFSAIDVIEEYTRPARIMENGKVVVKEALSEIEMIDFPGVGTLEAFNSDGLRSLTRTLDVPDMIEKTMRYPGHAEKMKLLRDIGLLGKTPVEVDGAEVVPLHLTAELLFPQLKIRVAATIRLQ
ncbi:saccharopine dehydrogenase NADP-binding domain-containing protein, partial [bacterium]|nr:saccharopine dehydrogenase NADP-binding domain-containing protein [bacterium]